MPEPVGGKGRYIPGLDGLRAVAVLAVIAYHLNLSFAPGGLLGVGVFFVLSGYLITDILASQWRETGHLQLKQFWLRRARRLLPALWVLLAAVVAWVTLFDRAGLAPLRGDVLAAFLYVSNWWYVFHHVSYFASFGRPSPLGNLWSLAVEEQFYLVWPLLLLLALRFVRRRGRIVGLTLALAAVSAIAMAVLFLPGTNPSRVYYGTDTRAFALLIGAALAMVWPSRQLSVRLPVTSRWVLDLVGTAGLLAILWMVWRTNEYEPFLYRGGLVVLSVLAAITVAAVAHPASRLGRVLGWGPLRWIGVRSYGIYLWHYPVIILTTPVVDTGGVNVLRDALQVGASIVLAALSWRFVEEPIRHGALGRLRQAMRHRTWWYRSPKKRVLTTSAVMVALGVVGVGLSGLIPVSGATPVARDTAAVPPGGSASGGVSQLTDTALYLTSPGWTGTFALCNPQRTSGILCATLGTFGSPAEGEHHQFVGQSSPAATGDGATQLPPSSPASVPALVTQSGRGDTTIGDSIMLDAKPFLEQILPGIVVDGKVGRQMIEAPTAVAKLRAQGELGQHVVIELGTNGSFTKSQLVQLLNSLGPVKQIVLVNVRVPRPWQNDVNTTLAEVAATYPHTTLVNWYAASANENGYFYPDGVHLNPTGARVYAELIAKALTSNG